LDLDKTAYNLLRLASILKAAGWLEISLSNIHSDILAHLESHLMSIGRRTCFSHAVQFMAVLSDIDPHMLESLLCVQLPCCSVDAFLEQTFFKKCRPA